MLEALRMAFQLSFANGNHEDPLRNVNEQCRNLPYRESPMFMPPPAIMSAMMDLGRLEDALDRLSINSFMYVGE